MAEPDKKFKSCILIVKPEPTNQASKGHEKLISLQINYLKNLGYEIYDLPLSEYSGLYPKLIRLLRNRRKYIEKIKTEKCSQIIRNLNWIFIAILRNFLLLIQRIDYKFITSIEREISKLGNKTKEIFILNNQGILNPKVINKDHCKKILVKHDIQCRLFRYLIDNSFIKKLVQLIIKFYEITTIKNSDIVLVLNEHDREFAVRYNKNAIVWVPVIFKNKEKKNKKPSKFIVGFLGSYWDLNIIAAKKIIEIASKLTEYDNIEFWIIGSVGKAIKNKKAFSIPRNVRIFGWVQDIHEYLSKCDIFLNPKIGITSGLEIKALDYLEHNKPIITTTAGAVGLPLNEENAIIEDDLSKWPEHILFLANNPEIIEKMKEKLIKDKKKFQDKMKKISRSIFGRSIYDE